MTETPHLDKLIRLATANVKSYQRTAPSGKVQTVRQYSQQRQGSSGAAAPSGSGGGTLGKAFTTSWQNVSTGEVVEFAPGDLWKVIPATQYPGYKPSTSSGTGTGSGVGSPTSTTVGAGTSGSSTTSGTGTGSSSSTGTANTNTSGNYLQNYYTPSKYAYLTLPNSTVVTVFPVIP